MSLIKETRSLPSNLPLIELPAIPEASHSILLAESFDNLYHELNTNGNTARFLELRKRYSARLIDFWQQKKRTYEAASQDAKETEPFKGDVLTIGDEKLTVIMLGVYESEDEAVLHIERETPTEKDVVTIAASLDFGLDEFLRPPKIKSEIRSDPSEPHDLEYEVVFRNGLISTFSRLRAIEDPNHKKPYIKVHESIDCSIFGVELPPRE